MGSVRYNEHGPEKFRTETRSTSAAVIKTQRRRAGLLVGAPRTSTPLERREAHVLAGATPRN